MEGLLVTIITDNKPPVTIDNEGEMLLPTPYRIDLKTIDDVRLEMARCYRDMRANKIPTSEGTRLVYVLSQIGKMIEIYDIEKRIAYLEQKNDTR